MVDAVGTTHHVKIGSQFYLVRPGSYRKRPAPLFGARFATGDPDFNNLSFWQHWAQTCWVGGFGAETWTDDAMFDEGGGIDARTHELMVLARDLGPSGSVRSSDGWNIEGRTYEKRLFEFNGSLYCLDFGSPADEALVKGRVYKHVGATWAVVHEFNDRVRSVAVFGGYMVFGDGGTTMVRLNPSHTVTTFAKPAGRTEVPYAMKVYRGHLYVNFGNQIWRLKSDFTWDGSTSFYEATGVDYIRHMEIHLGMLYMLSQNGHMLRSDGNNTFDLWQFEEGLSFTNGGMRSFDGRLFVGANQPLVGTHAQEAVLFQFSGSAVTELKRWGQSGKDIATGNMRVIGSWLFFGAASMLGMGDGFGIAAYDAREDAYHMFATNRDDTSYPAGTENIFWNVDDVIYFQGYVYCAVRGSGIFRALLAHNDVVGGTAKYDTTASGASSGSKNGGWFSSSDFDGGTPGLPKLWNALTVHCDLPNDTTSILVETSVDGGATWRVQQNVTKTSATETRYATIIVLVDDAGDPLRSTRLKYRLTLRTTNSLYSPILRGVIVRYLPIPEPGWQWDMILVCSDTQELLDGEIRDSIDVPALFDNVEDALRVQDLVPFIDLDGRTWDGVLIVDSERIILHKGPDSEGALEGDLRVRLIEAVEAYP